MITTAFKQISAFFGIITLVVLVLVFGPLLTIWSINTLFGTTIAYSLSTWFAVIVLGSVIKTKVWINK